MRSPIERAVNVKATLVFIHGESGSWYVCVAYPDGYLRLMREPNKNAAFLSADKLSKELKIAYTGECEDPGSTYPIKR